MGIKQQSYHTRRAVLHIIKTGGMPIEIIIHQPETSEKQALFDARVEKCHVEYVIQYIKNLNCSITQKKQLLDAVAQTILEGCEEMESHPV